MTGFWRKMQILELVSRNLVRNDFIAAFPRAARNFLALQLFPVTYQKGPSS
jgi:hypothetical protein